MNTIDRYGAAYLIAARLSGAAVVCSLYGAFEWGVSIAKTDNLSVISRVFTAWFWAA